MVNMRTIEYYAWRDSQSLEQAAMSEHIRSSVRDSLWYAIDDILEIPVSTVIAAQAEIEAC